MANEQQTKYLDLEGLIKYDEKLKAYIESIFGTKQEIHDEHEWGELGQQQNKEGE